MSISYRTDLSGVDWEKLRQTLIVEDFHNGRTTDQLQRSFENSSLVVVAWDAAAVVGTARALSDGVGNAYIVDVWTKSSRRLTGIGRSLIANLIARLPGQHIYLQSDDAVEFFKRLGFRKQPHGMSLVSGVYLDAEGTSAQSASRKTVKSK